jgi:sugar/nucleoside kinase (ribokinase family)
MGAAVGVVTSTADSIDLSALDGLSIFRRPAAHSTSFENRYGATGRVQTLLSRAEDLRLSDVPPDWRGPAIAHLAPIDREIDLQLCGSFPDAFVGLTPQGLMREWNSDGRVTPLSWEACADYLPLANAVVLSIEDLGMDWQSADAMATHCRALIVTEGPRGARLCFEGKWIHRPAHESREVDPTGAGDIFAALFFTQFQRTGDPVVAVDTANRIAAVSVTRRGLAGVPSPAEVRAGLQAMDR